MGDHTRQYHQEAKELFNYFIDEKMRILLSTIVLSEYAIVGNIDSLLSLYTFEIIAFNLPHAKKSAEVNFVKYKGQNTPRGCLKDDFKIIGQCIIEKNIDYFAFEDAPLNKILENDGQAMGIEFTPIYLPNGKAHYFGQ